MGSNPSGDLLHCYRSMQDYIIYIQYALWAVTHLAISSTATGLSKTI